MKFAKTIPFFILITILFVQCDNKDTTKNLLNAPKNWRSEVLKFPLDFANSLPYTGEEHIRFAPGWGDKNAEDYFSYVFVWNIDQEPDLSSIRLETQMEAYFDGLIHLMKSENQNDIPKTKAFFEKLNDSVYVGKILTYDVFTAHKKIQLNVIVEKKNCSGYEKKVVRFDISPKPTEHFIWKKMKNIVVNLKCN